MRELFDLSTLQKRFWWSLFATALFLNMGYAPLGVSNQVEQIPMIRRLLDPNFLVNDWYTNFNGWFNHRVTFTVLVAGLAKIIGLQNAYLLLTFLAVWMAVWAAMQLATLIWKPLPAQRQAFAILVSVVLLIRSEWGGLGVPAGISVSLEPALLAVPLCLWGWVALFQNRYLGAGAAYLVASCLHPLAAPQILFLSLFARFYELDKAGRLAAWKPFLALAIVSLLPMAALAHFTVSGKVSAAQARHALEVLALYRAPHHYAPWTWAFPLWLSFGAAIAFCWILRRQTGAWRFGDALLVGAALFALTGLLPIVFDASWNWAKMQPFRMTILIPMILALYFGRFVGALPLEKESNSLRQNDVWLGAALACALLLNRYASFTLPPDYDFWLTPLVWTIAFAAFLLARHLAPRLIWLQWLVLAPWWLAFWPSNWVELPFFFLLLVGIVTLLGLLSPDAKTRFHPSPRLVQTSIGAVTLLLTLFYVSNVRALASWDPPHERALFSWAQQHTPRSAVFLIPPDLLRFRLRAERAIVADWKCIPFRDVGILEWEARIKTIKAALARRESDWADWSAIAQRFDADYLVLPTTISLPQQPLYKNPEFAVYAVPQTPPAP